MNRKTHKTWVFMAVVLAAMAVLMLPIAAPAGIVELGIEAPTLVSSGATANSTMIRLPGGAIAEPQAEPSLILDDGGVENNIGIGGTLEMLWVNRFTPDAALFPFVIDQVSVWFASQGLVAVGDDITLILFENTAGSTDPAVGANFLGSFDTTVQALDAWNVYSLSTPVTFNGPGDAVIGVIAGEIPGSSYWPAAIDQTASQGRSWAGWYNASPPPNPPTLPSDTWILIDNAGYPGNWMIRASGNNSACNIDVDPLSLSTIQPLDTVTQQTLIISNTGSADLKWEILEEPAGAAAANPAAVCDNPADLPWLSVDPDNGTTPPGDNATVDVTFDSTGLAVGTYNANLCVASNDPDNGTGNGTELVVVPVTLEVVQECVTDDDCEGDTPVCDEAAHVCVQCLSAGDCAEGWTCEDSVCMSPCELIVKHKRIRSDKLTKNRKVTLNVTSEDELFDVFGLIDLEPLSWQSVKFNQRNNRLEIKAIVPAGLAPGVYPLSVGDCFGEVVVE